MPRQGEAVRRLRVLDPVALIDAARLSIDAMDTHPGLPIPPGAGSSLALPDALRLIADGVGNDPGCLPVPLKGALREVHTHGSPSRRGGGSPRKSQANRRRKGEAERGARSSPRNASGTSPRARAHPSRGGGTKQQQQQEGSPHTLSVTPRARGRERGRGRSFGSGRGQSPEWSEFSASPRARSNSRIPHPSFDAPRVKRAFSSEREVDVIRNPLRRNSIPRQETGIPLLNFDRFRTNRESDVGGGGGDPRRRRGTSGLADERRRGEEGDDGSAKPSPPGKHGLPGQAPPAPRPPVNGASSEHHRRERHRQGRAPADEKARAAPRRLSPIEKGTGRGPGASAPAGADPGATPPRSTARQQDQHQARQHQKRQAQQRPVLPQVEAARRIVDEKRKRHERARRARDYAEHLRKRHARKDAARTAAQNGEVVAASPSEIVRSDRTAGSDISSLPASSDLGSKQDLYDEQLEKLMDIQDQFV